SASSQLSYTVPEGWAVVDDSPTAFVLDRVGGVPGEPSTPLSLFVFVDPRMAADSGKGAICGELVEAPGVGHGRDDLVDAIIARDGVASGPPATLTIGGFAGRMLDLGLASGWADGCVGPGGPLAGMSLLYPAGSPRGPVVGVNSDHQVRIILVSLPDGETVAIAIGCATGPVPFDEQVALAMPIVESFEFHVPSH